MKKAVTILTILTLLIITIKAQEISQKDNSLIDNIYISKIILAKERISSEELGKVFSGNFYRVSPRFALGADESLFTCTKKIMIINNGKIFEMASFATNLEPLIKNNFFLKTESEVNIFETALDAIDPISEWDLGDKEHLKKDNKWYFVRKVGFGYKHAYIVITDQNSKITDIDFSREAIKTE
jgi:hypothetical protein